MQECVNFLSPPPVFSTAPETYNQNKKKIVLVSSIYTPLFQLIKQKSGNYMHCDYECEVVISDTKRQISV